MFPFLGEKNKGFFSVLTNLAASAPDISCGRSLLEGASAALPGHCTAASRAHSWSSHQWDIVPSANLNETKHESIQIYTTPLMHSECVHRTQLAPLEEDWR